MILAVGAFVASAVAQDTLPECGVSYDFLFRPSPSPESDNCVVAGAICWTKQAMTRATFDQFFAGANCLLFSA